MKVSLLFLALGMGLSSTRAQMLPTVSSKTVNPQGKAATARQTADRRAAAYKGPKVAKSTKALGNEMLHDSKPAPKSVVAPVKE